MSVVRTVIGMTKKYGKCLHQTDFRTPAVSVKRFKTFKAAVLHEHGGSLQLEEKSSLKLKKGEVRIQVSYCGLNMTDVLLCQGKYKTTLKLPYVPGYEVSGEVLEVGSDAVKEGFKQGQKVVGLSKDHFGGLSEEIVLSVADVWTLPQSIKLKKASAVPDTYTTAFLGLTRRVRLSEKSCVLVTAAAGGLGLAAVDIVANVYRAKVIAVCETENQASLLRDRGAWAALVYKPKDVLKKVQEITEGRGVDIFLDALGDDSFEQLHKCVAYEGSVILAGFASRTAQQIETSALLPKAISVTGVSLGCYRVADRETYRNTVQDVIDMYEQALITPHIEKVFSLSEVNQAFEYMVGQHTTGKVVVKVLDD